MMRLLLIRQFANMNGRKAMFAFDGRFWPIGKQPAVRAGPRNECAARVLKCADEKKRTTDESVMRLDWRRGPESNRARRICNPLHNRFATAPCLSRQPQTTATGVRLVQQAEAL